MFLRQFLLLRFTLPGGVARARGENGSAAPPVIANDEGADRPGRHAAGAGGAASRKKEAKGAAPGRRLTAPSGDKGTQKAKKASVAPKEK